MASSSPPDGGGVDVTIEYCSGCRWMLRATWLASELLTTFANESKLASVTLVSQGPPLCDGGFFGVSASSSSGGGSGERVMLWDRKVKGRFPEAKEVKQLVRDCVNPDKDLGHSENKEESPVAKDEDCVECKEAEQGQTVAQQASDMEKQVAEEPEQSASIPSIFYEQNRVSIEYSTGSSVESPNNGLYTATYYANELLSVMYARNAWWKQSQQGEGSSAGTEDAPVAVDSVTLIPNRLESGVLKVTLNTDSVVYEQSEDADSIVDGGRLRDIVTRAIRNGGEPGPAPDAVGMELMDDDEAEEARKYFGVL
ncbi:hypothetical protein ACHAXT_012985 [Thalassiosira profunda]